MNPAAPVQEATAPHDTQAARLASAWRLEARSADGRLRGIFDVDDLASRFYTGIIDQSCRVRLPAESNSWPVPDDSTAGAWFGIVEVPRVRRVMDILGIEPAQPEGERRIAGWQKSAEPDNDIPLDSQGLSQPLAAVAPQTSENRLPIVWLVAGTVLLLLVFLGIGVLLSG